MTADTTALAGRGLQSAMGRFADVLSRRRRWVVAIWGVLVLASLPFAANENEHLTGGGYGVPGSQSQTVQDQIGSFPGVQANPLAVVLSTKGASSSAVSAEVSRVATDVQQVPHLALGPVPKSGASTSGSGNSVLVIPLVVDANQDQAIDAAKNLRAKIGVGTAHDGVVPHVIGEAALWAAIQDVSKQDLETAEGAGFPVVFIVLLAVVGSLAAAVLPLGLGFASVGITGALIYFLSQHLGMSIFVSNIASLLGIGVAVDYSLFILARYREEVGKGASPERARRTALATSGIAVVFSGVTVMIALAGLFLINSQTMRSMAIGALIVVAISVLAAVTLLPALIAVLGRRAHEPGRYVTRVKNGIKGTAARLRRRKPGAAPSGGTFWDRWTATVMRRPALFAPLAAVVMLAIAIPALSMKWGNAALHQLPANNEARVGVDEASRALGPGTLTPDLVLVKFNRGPANSTTNAAALRRYEQSLRGLPGVASVGRPVPSRGGSSVMISVVPASDAESSQADQLVSELRSSSGPLAGVASVSVGGGGPLAIDFKNLVSGSLWKIFLFVMVVTYVVLLILLRSVILPLKAVLMNLLTVAAAYGVLVGVFQYGWIDGLINYHHLGYVNATTPPLVLTIVFGLSMDYEVFLLTRIRERYEASGDTQTAVAQGLSSSARVISGAAVIMVLVFLIFAFVGLPSVKEIGVGLAVAIALDATIVRLVLVPTTMALMGGANWWLPGSLDRILPRTDFEAAPAPVVPVGDLGTSVTGVR